jgi:hypothetical protein
MEDFPQLAAGFFDLFGLLLTVKSIVDDDSGTCSLIPDHIGHGADFHKNIIPCLVSLCSTGYRNSASRFIS